MGGVIRVSEWGNACPLPQRDSPLPHRRTPLHCSASCSNLEMVQFLIHNGASVFTKTVDGQTPLRVAYEEFEDSGEGEGSAASECLDYLLCEWGRVMA